MIIEIYVYIGLCVTRSKYVAKGFVNAEREPTSWALTRHWVGGVGVCIVVTAPTTGKLGIIVFFFFFVCTFVKSLASIV